MKLSFFSSYVSKKLNELGISQNECAKRTNFISPGQLSRVLNGESKPSADLLAPLAKVLRVPVTDLLFAYLGKDPEEKLSDIELSEVMNFVKNTDDVTLIFEVINVANQRIMELMNRQDKK
jgi:transcriptional regulator with XRE-family HTH domain